MKFMHENAINANAMQTGDIGIIASGKYEGTVIMKANGFTNGDRLVILGFLPNPNRLANAKVGDYWENNISFKIKACPAAILCLYGVPE